MRTNRLGPFTLTCQGEKQNYHRNSNIPPIVIREWITYSHTEFKNRESGHRIAIPATNSSLSKEWKHCLGHLGQFIAKLGCLLPQQPQRVRWLSRLKARAVEYLLVLIILFKFHMLHFLVFREFPLLMSTNNTLVQFLIMGCMKTLIDVTYIQVHRSFRSHAKSTIMI